MAQRHRTQARNRQDALDRLLDLIRRATVRRSTAAAKATRASRERRIEGKNSVAPASSTSDEAVIRLMKRSVQQRVNAAGDRRNRPSVIIAKA